MTDVKRLLDEATPLPWREEPYMGASDHSFGCDIRSGGTGDYADRVTCGGIEGLDASVPHHADAALITYAVNRLPDYEAAVDALVAVSRKEYDDGPCWCEVGPNGNFPNHLDLCQQARAALARLRGKVPA